MKHLYKQGLRRCYVCKEIKNLYSDFYRSKNSSLGHTFICKGCKSAKQRLNRKPPISISNDPRPYYQRHRSAIVIALGGKCKHCGLENEIHSFFDIDHVIPINMGRRRKKHRLEEIDQYQLLCPNCHRLKTLKDMGVME